MSFPHENNNIFHASIIWKLRASVKIIRINHSKERRHIRLQEAALGILDNVSGLLNSWLQPDRASGGDVRYRHLAWKLSLIKQSTTFFPDHPHNIYQNFISFLYWPHQVHCQEHANVMSNIIKKYFLLKSMKNFICNDFFQYDFNFAICKLEIRYESQSVGSGLSLTRFEFR